MGDYTPASNALAASEQASALSADERKNAAFNALAKAYGPQANDPDAALKMQQFGQHELTDPIAVQQAQADLTGKNLSNTGTQQTNDFNFLANPKKLTGLDLENTGKQDQNTQTEQTTDFDAQLQPGKVAQQGAQLDSTKAATRASNASTAASNAETAQRRFTLATDEGQADRTSAMGLLAGLSDVVNQGGDLGEAFDRLAPQIAKFEGTTPDHLQGLRAKLLQDPANTISQLGDAINAANQAAAASKGGAGALNTLKFNEAKQAQVNALNVTAQRTQAVPAATDQALALVSAMSASAILRKARAAIPGTPEYKFEQLVTQIKTNASLDDLRALRASGTSLGRVTNTEFTASANAFANLDLGQDPKMLAGNLGRLKSTYGVINDNLQADIARLSKTSGGNAAKAPAPAAKAADGKKYVKDTVYQDAKGNKAKWDGTKFVPAN
jgi:hypothetical protein